MLPQTITESIKLRRVLNNNNGVPQGSVISPTNFVHLFIIAQPVCKRLHKACTLQTQLIMYAQMTSHA